MATSPEGASMATDESPGPFKPGVFLPAASIDLARQFLPREPTTFYLNACDCMLNENGNKGETVYRKRPSYEQKGIRFMERAVFGRREGNFL